MLLSLLDEQELWRKQIAPLLRMQAPHPASQPGYSPPTKTRAIERESLSTKKVRNPRNRAVWEEESSAKYSPATQELEPDIVMESLHSKCS
jgi:hypothetical protein